MSLYPNSPSAPCAALPNEDPGDPVSAPPPKHKKLRRGDVRTGSVHFTGAYLHVPDHPVLYPAGDDALLATVGRVIIQRRWNDRIGLHINDFIDVSRRPAAGGAWGGAFGTAGTTDSVLGLNLSYSVSNVADLLLGVFIPGERTPPALSAPPTL